MPIWFRCTKKIRGKRGIRELTRRFRLDQIVMVETDETRENLRRIFLTNGQSFLVAGERFSEFDILMKKYLGLSIFG